MKKKPFLYCFSAEKFQEISGPRRKSGEKPHYMVEAPRRDSICGGWSRGKRFGIIDRQKVHPPGFLGKVYKGGIAMKGKKKLLSVLLAAALVGQMGVVVGMGTPACGHTSPAGKECRDGIHWIDAQSNVTGGTGINYFDASDSSGITCGGTKSVIVIDTAKPGISGGAGITVTNFDVKTDTIYILGVTNDDIAILESETDEGEGNSPGYEIVVGQSNLTVSPKNHGDKLEKGKQIKAIKSPGVFQFKQGGDLPATKEVEKGAPLGLSVTVENQVGSLTYIWETEDTTGWKEVKKGNTLNDKLQNEIGTTAKYRCIVIDDIGQVLVSQEVTVTSAGCAVKASLKDITGILNDGATVFTSDTKISVSDLIAFDNALCHPQTGTTHENHGYAISEWKVVPADAGVKVENGELVLTAAEFPKDATTPVTLTATLNKDNIIKEYKFSVKGAETTPEPPEETDPPVTPENPDPENPDPENPGGPTTDPDPSKPGETENPKPEEKPEEKPENPKPEEKPEDPKPETPPTITIGGKDDNEKPKDEINITEPIKEPITQVYTINIKNADESKYAFSWVLTEKNKADAKTPTYISCSPNDKKATTVTITKDIPLNTDTTFVLTATATPITKTKTRAATADQNGVVTVQHEIRVVNTANDPDNPGGTTTTPPDATGCKGAPKKVSVTFDPATVNFPENMPGAEMLVKWIYNVTEWTGTKCDIEGCDHNLSWTIETTDKEAKWVTHEDGKAEFKIIGKSVPKQKDNKITLTASVKKTDGSTSPVEVANGTFTVTRDPKCEATVKSIEIIKKSRDLDTISVAKNKTGYGYYDVRIEYNEGACDKEGHTKTDHKAAVKWEILKVNSAEYKDDGTFTIGENGTLTAKGSKLVANKEYKVEIQATAGGQNDVRTIAVKCTPATSSGTTGGSSSSDDDTDDTDWYQWQDFEDDIHDAKKGSTVKVNLRDNTDMPFYIFDEVRGRDVNLQMKVSGGYTWTVNGKTVKKLPENQVWVALGVDSYKNSRMSTLCRSYDVKSFQLENKGSFYGDMKLTMNVGSSYAKKTMFLYSYDEDKNKLTYCSSSKADDTGDVSFVFARSLGAYVVTSKALYGESAVGSGGGTVGGTGSGNSPTTVYPPVASVPASKPPASSSSSSSSSSQSSSSSEPAPPPAEPSSTPDTTPTDTKTEPEQKAKIPVLVPVLILSIAGVITATVLVVRSGRGKEDF